jgi:UDP-2,4-diacetamido-2,4,6-trideoxy-beta-L-altropyranose hydrolase
MRVAFRVDSSLDIGTGHVMRCLTLANVLHQQGFQCSFICRVHPRHMLEQLKQSEHTVHELPLHHSHAAIPSDQPHPAKPYESWLGASTGIDAEQTLNILSQERPDWLIIDHYAIDRNWEVLVKPMCKQIMVIDDLANRQHVCDLLLDQNAGRLPEHYQLLAPVACKLFMGQEFSLLRSEFLQLRQYSIQRRLAAPLNSLLISMGGIDQGDYTSKVLRTLAHAQLPSSLQIRVVMGANAPFLQAVQELASSMPWSTEVLVNVHTMAQLMADSDLAIGAGGITALERCSVCLPSIAIAVAANQERGLSSLHTLGATTMLTLSQDWQLNLLRQLKRLAQAPELISMQTACQQLKIGVSLPRLLGALAHV